MKLFVFVCLSFLVLSVNAGGFEPEYKEQEAVKEKGPTQYLSAELIEQQAQQTTATQHETKARAEPKFIDAEMYDKKTNCKKGAGCGGDSNRKPDADAIEFPDSIAGDPLNQDLTWMKQGVKILVPDFHVAPRKIEPIGFEPSYIDTVSKGKAVNVDAVEYESKKFVSAADKVYNGVSKSDATYAKPYFPSTDKKAFKLHMSPKAPKKAGPTFEFVPFEADKPSESKSFTPNHLQLHVRLPVFRRPRKVVPKPQRHLPVIAKEVPKAFPNYFFNSKVTSPSKIAAALKKQKQSKKAIKRSVRRGAPPARVAFLEQQEESNSDAEGLTDEQLLSAAETKERESMSKIDHVDSMVTNLLHTMDLATTSTVESTHDIMSPDFLLQQNQNDGFAVDSSFIQASEHQEELKPDMFAQQVENMEDTVSNLVRDLKNL